MFSPQRFQPIKVISFALLLFSTLIIFSLSEVIRLYLSSYELNSMYISFCAGFILFTPLVSLVLHPLFFSKNDGHETIKLSAFLGNIGLVTIVQCLCFLIWITDAIALYSLYVDQNSFLAKAFNIKSTGRLDLSIEFYWFNLILAYFFALLSLVIGVLPCLISRIQNKGVVGNFVSAFVFAKQYKKQLLVFSLLLVISVVFTLLYLSYLFLVFFPLVLLIIFTKLKTDYFCFIGNSA